jgi:DNA-binding CsgD family transcriptional regulator
MFDPHEIREETCFFCEAGWAGLSDLLDLSKREVDILACLLLDDSMDDVAALLQISVRTVGTHLQRIHKKLNVHSRTALVVKLLGVHVDWLCEASPPPGCRLNARLSRPE